MKNLEQMSHLKELADITMWEIQGDWHVFSGLDGFQVTEEEADAIIADARRQLEE